MNNTIKLVFFIGFHSLFLTGCWDIQDLTNLKIVNGISIDAAKDGQMSGAVRAVILESKGGGQFDVKDKVMQATGDTVSKIGSKIDSMLPGTLRANKTHVIIIGEELARKGIMSPLETFYRYPKGYLNSNVVVSQGLASDIISFEKIENNPVAYGILQMIDGAERKNIVRKQTLYSVWNQALAPGDDMVLPVIRKINDKSLIIDSTGLFNGDKFTGATLSQEDSALLLLLDGKLINRAVMDIPIRQGSGGIKSKDLISFEVHKFKRSLEVSVDQNTQEIECSIKLDLYGTISSYPSHQGRTINREQLNQDIAATLNQNAVGVVNILQKANCDALGIGRKLKANHFELWKHIDWKKKYKDVKVKPRIQFHITSTGVIK